MKTYREYIVGHTLCYMEEGKVIKTEDNEKNNSIFFKAMALSVWFWILRLKVQNWVNHLDFQNHLDKKYRIIEIKGLIEICSTGMPQK